MDKITLEHLAPYLPYGLKCQYIRWFDGVLVIGDFTLADAKHLIENSGFKPILRPLSDLITVPEHIIKMGYRSISRNGGECFTLKQYKYLFANHFDVFGLIDAGLAIDINTLKGEPNNGI